MPAAEPAAAGPAAAANAASAMPPAATLLCPGAAASTAVRAATLLRLAATCAAACIVPAAVSAVSLGATPPRPLSGRFPSGAPGREAPAPCRPRRQQFLCDTVLAEALAVTGGPCVPYHELWPTPRNGDNHLPAARLTSEGAGCCAPAAFCATLPRSLALFVSCLNTSGQASPAFWRRMQACGRCTWGQQATEH